MNHNNPDAKQVQRTLYEQGKTLRSWCRKHGHSYRTTLNALSRHAGGHAREPWGRKTRAALRDLSREIGQEIIPGALTD
jgi:transposase